MPISDGIFGSSAPHTRWTDTTADGYSGRSGCRAAMPAAAKQTGGLMSKALFGCPARGRSDARRRCRSCTADRARRRPKPRPRSRRPGASSPSASASKKCGAEWKEAKAAGKVEKGMKWPQFWSACNKRLKGGDLARNTRQKNFPAANAPRASARLEVSPTPSVVIGTGAPRSNCIALVAP